MVAFFLFGHSDEVIEIRDVEPAPGNARIKIEQPYGKGARREQIGNGHQTAHEGGNADGPRVARGIEEFSPQRQKQKRSQDHARRINCKCQVIEPKVAQEPNVKKRSRQGRCALEQRNAYAKVEKRPRRSEPEHLRLMGQARGVGIVLQVQALARAEPEQSARKEQDREQKPGRVLGTEMP